LLLDPLPPRLTDRFRSLVGRKFSDPDFQAYVKTLPYDVVEKDGKPLVKIQVQHETKLLYPEEIAAKILEKFKTEAEEYLQRKVAYAVISVPARYNDTQRQATKDAGIIAGLNVLRVVNEPTAAAIAYDLDRQESELQFLVYDLQSRTFDVTVEDVEQGIYEIKSRASDTHLGGDDFDDALLNYAIQFLHENHNFHLGRNSKYMEILREKVESAKERLQTEVSTTIHVEIDAYEEVTITFSNHHLQYMHKQLFEKTLVLVEKVLKETNMTELPIGALIMSGNPAHIAIVEPLLSAYFPNAKIYDELPSDQLVVQGVAVQAMVLSDDSGWDIYLPLVAVNPVGLGVETVGGVFEKIVPRNWVVPLRKTKVFSTIRDNQEKVAIKIFGGERAWTNNNKFVTEVELTGIPLAPKGVPRIEVTFEITEEVCTIKASLVNEGEMKIAVEEKVLSPLQKLWAESTWELIGEMVTDSEKHWDEDELVRKDPVREPREGGEDRFGITTIQETAKQCSGIC
jgi:heat shock protein 5